MPIERTLNVNERINSQNLLIYVVNKTIEIYGYELPSAYEATLVV